MAGLRLEYQDLWVAPLAAAAGQLDGGDVLMLGAGPLATGRGAWGHAFTPDVGPVARAVRAVGPRLYMDAQLKTLVSLSGQDPDKAAGAAAASLVETGNADLAVAVVRGQDVLDRLEELMLHTDLAHWDTGQRFADLNAKTVAAVASLGPRPTAQALKQGARVVLTGSEHATVLAEAAAWSAFANQDCPAAARAGSVLARFSNALVADSLQQPNWTPQERLQAEVGPDGGVEFYGSERMCDAARQALAGMQLEGPPALSSEAPVPLELIYVDGYQAEVCVDALYPYSPERLDSILTNAPAVVKSCLDDEFDTIFHERLNVIRLRNASRDRLAAAVDALATVLHVAGIGRELGVMVVGGPPAVRPVLESWSTRLPAELLEWSIDIKPAAQWVN